DAVLLPRRCQAVPMDQARLVNLVFDANAKRLADIRVDPECPARLANAVDRSRLSIHLDIAALQLQNRPRRRIAVRSGGRRVLRLRNSPHASRCCKCSHNDRTARQHLRRLPSSLSDWSLANRRTERRFCVAPAGGGGSVRVGERWRRYLRACNTLW